MKWTQNKISTALVRNRKISKKPHNILLCKLPEWNHGFLIEESKKLIFAWALVVSTPHQVRTVIPKGKDSWILKYEANLMEKDDLVSSVDDSLNPASFLWKGSNQTVALEHDCLDYQTQVWPDLGDLLLHSGKKCS